MRQQTAVAELGRYALQGPELPEIFAKAAELVARALEVSFGTVTELLPGGKHLRVRGAFGWPVDMLGRTVANWRVPGPDGQLSDSEPLVIADLRRDNPVRHPAGSAASGRAGECRQRGRSTAAGNRMAR